LAYRRRQNSCGQSFEGFDDLSPDVDVDGVDGVEAEIEDELSELAAFL
jgi:hypothetical protein